MTPKIRILLSLVTAVWVLVFALPGFVASDSGFPNVSNQSWQAGEKLEYAIKYGPIQAGSTSFITRESEKVGDRRTIRIDHNTKSAVLFFYRLEHSISSLIDMNGLFSWRSWKKQVEGENQYQEIVEYLPSEQRAKRTVNGKEKVEKTGAYVKDMLGALFYLRTQSFKPGDVITIPVFDGGKSYNLEVAVRSRETVRVPAGTFNCLVIEPNLQSEGTFSKKGRLLIWVTDDERHVPVRIRTMVSIGSVVANLVRLEGSLPE